MKIREGFVLRELANINIVMKRAEAGAAEQAVFALNETGALLFQELKNECTQEELAEALCREYCVGTDEAAADTAEFLDLLAQWNVLEE